MKRLGLSYEDDGQPQRPGARRGWRGLLSAAVGLLALWAVLVSILAVAAWLAGLVAR